LALFLAIKPPNEIRKQLSQLCFGIPNIRWINEENLHITLRFFGNVDNNTLLDIKETLFNINTSSFQLKLSSPNHFSSRKQIVLWLTPSPSQPLLELRKQIDRSLIELNVQANKTHFIPHLTLGYITTANFHPDKTPKFLNSISHFASSPFEVNKFHLLSSKLTEKRAIYTIESEYPLSK
jgi:2'-5' RNA ligase